MDRSRSFSPGAAATAQRRSASRTASCPPGPHDLRLGEIGGAPFYIDSEQYERWGRPRFLIDVAEGAAEGFSLEGLEGVHFISRTPLVCDAPQPAPPNLT
jgi:uncharacterized protein (DUF779 family)